MDEEIKEIKLDGGATAPPRRFSFNRRWLVVVLGVLIVLGLLIGVPLYKAYGDTKKAYTLALGIKDAAKSQDIKKTNEAISLTRAQVQIVQRDINLVGWTRFIPFLGGYTSDVIHMTNAGVAGLDAAGILTQAIEPYADILGLKGQGTFTGGTTEERMAKLVETLGKVTPQLDAVADKMAIVQKEIDQVDASHYPETVGNRPVRTTLKDMKSVVDLSGELFTKARPMVKKLPDLLGANTPATYMVLFQNNAELRPTGGFITAYAIFTVDKGKIHLVTSDDIYKLDGTLTLNVAPPDPISKYLNVYGWRMRDANFSPDFNSSMRTFEDLYNHSTGKQKIDGIIAVDTHVLIEMMNVLGPVNIYGTNFTTQKVPGCDCPMVIYELEKYADQPTYYERGSRKDIIGVLLSALMTKALTGSKAVYGPLFQGMIDEARQKHVLLYLHDTDAQAGIEALGFGGRIKTYDGDYLHVNDANLAGAKSNLYIVPSVKQDVTVDTSGATEKLTLQYKYPHPADNCSLERKEGLCLAGIYRDYVRVYLPLGTTILDTRGFENKSNTFTDLGHTVVDGYFTVVPQGLANIQISYKISGNFLKNKEYRSLIQKQPGTDGNAYTVTVNGQKMQFNLLEDKEISVKL